MLYFSYEYASLLLSWVLFNARIVRRIGSMILMLYLVCLMKVNENAYNIIKYVHEVNSVRLSFVVSSYHSMQIETSWNALTSRYL